MNSLASSRHADMVAIDGHVASASWAAGKIWRVAFKPLDEDR